MLIFYIVLAIIPIIIIFFVWRWINDRFTTHQNLSLLGPEAPVLTQDDFSFRDLNKNGKLDPYEDSRLPVAQRIEDLLGRMTLEEKVGMMFHPMIGMNLDGSLDERKSPINPVKTSGFIARRMINHFNIYQTPGPRQLATWYNRVQKMAERTRLGIPVTISTDPRHGFSQNTAANLAAGSFSRWPEPLGLAATGDPALVKEFGDIARQEYLAVGIRTALHPMADLATEPRWARINGTFGEDARLAAQMVTAYIRGFQGEVLGPHSVACMTKHFPGGGPQKDGEDPHFSYGKDQVYPGGNFEYHLIPFEAAFDAGTTQIMPYYGKPVGLPFEEVGFSFNHQVITDLLRLKYGFDGVVCTDWMLLNDIKYLGRTIIDAKCWGVEELSVEQRVQKAIEAGVDQFGGESCVDVLLQLVKSGQISESRIDQSIRRLLRDKFRLGLFDNPYVDVDSVDKVVGREEFLRSGALAQRKSIVLLKNTVDHGRNCLPLTGKPKIFIENIDRAVAEKYATVVQSVEEADYAILRLRAPFEPRKGFLERMFHAGDLDFKSPDKERIVNILAKIPTVVDIYCDRPPVIPEIVEKCVALFANFGADDEAILDIIFGRFTPCGKLPVEFPSSMETVRGQKEDVPYDSENPSFPFGFGLTYE